MLYNLFKVGISCIAIFEPWVWINEQRQSLYDFQQSLVKLFLWLENALKLKFEALSLTKFEPSPRPHLHSNPIINKHTKQAKILQHYIQYALWALSIFFQSTAGHIKAPKWHLKGLLATSKWHALLVYSSCLRGRMWTDQQLKQPSVLPGHFKVVQYHLDCLVHDNGIQLCITS